MSNTKHISNYNKERVNKLYSVLREDRITYEQDSKHIAKIDLIESCLDELISFLGRVNAHNLLKVVLATCEETVDTYHSWELVDTRERETIHERLEATEIIRHEPTVISSLYAIVLFWLDEFLEFEMLNDFPTVKKVPHDEIKRLYLVKVGWDYM